MFRENDQIGSYKLVKKLGRGAFGVVWLAEEHTQVSTHRVALKLPNEDDIDIETIRQEAALWESVKGHPNILPIIKADVVDGQMYIASEYASDGSLSNWLKQHGGKAPTVETAVEMMKGILSGLGHLHSKRVIHRDLKPDNILLQANIPRIADFGISRLLKTTIASTNAAGTPAYMAPECFEGNRSETSDLWSVGVIFYQLMTGKLPFPQSDSISLMNGILMREPQIDSHLLPNGFEPIIRKILEKDPNRRFQSAEEIYAALRDVKAEKAPANEKTEVISESIHTVDTIVFENTITEIKDDSPYKTKPMDHESASLTMRELKTTIASPKTEVLHTMPSTTRIFDANIQKEDEISNKNLFIGIAGVAVLILILTSSILIYLYITSKDNTNTDKSSSDSTTSISESLYGVKVDLPRDMNNPTADPAISKASSAVIAVPNNNEIYINKASVSKEQLGNEIKRLTQQQSEDERTVYIAASAGVEYGNIVEIIKTVRTQEIDNLGLIAERRNNDSETQSRFQIKIPSKPDPNMDKNLKPNPLTLVVSISNDETMKLNNEDMGILADTSALSKRLVEEFQRRKDNKVNRIGSTTVETTVFVKAPRSMVYGKIVRVIDALKGADADPIGLQIDDLIEDKKTNTTSESSKKDAGEEKPVEKKESATSDVEKPTPEEKPETDYNKIFKSNEVTQKAVITSKPQPNYTSEARTNNVQGVVRISAVLSASGGVTNIRQLSGLPFGLTERTIAATRQIQFIPAKKDGRYVSR